MFASLNLKFIFIAYLALIASIVPVHVYAGVEVITFSEQRLANENFLLITPRNFNKDNSYPILFAPGESPDDKPIFYAGNDPEALGWVIVQTHRVYNGSQDELSVVINKALEILKSRDIKVVSKHIIGWSANSSSVARQAAAQIGQFNSLTLLPGYADQKTAALLCKQPQIHISFITGANDSGWLRGAENMKNQLEACGQKPSFEIIKNGGHILKELSGRPLFDRLENNWR